jgi:ribonuclease T1
MSPRTRRLLTIIVPIVIALVGAFAARSGGDGSTGSSASAGSNPSVTIASDGRSGSQLATSVPARTTTTRPGRSSTPTTEDPTLACVSGNVREVSVGDLPDEALDTLALIASDGPFPYHQDGVVFQNREGILPKNAKGYYHEYTVVTPGSPDRGARRIIVGECGDRWFTDDHYATFELIVGQP